MPLDLARIHGVCFDVDGTLSDTDDEWTSRVAKLLGRVSFLFPHRDVRTAARWMIMASETPMNMVLRVLDIFSLDATFARLFDKLIRNHKHPHRPFWLMAHAREVLEDLSARYACAVVSARDEFTTQEFIQQFNLAGYLKTVITSQTCTHSKPFADPILEAAARMGVAPGECVMIGDTTVDILAGKAAGAQTIGLLCGFGTEQELRKAGADLILPSLDDVRGVLQTTQTTAE